MKYYIIAGEASGDLHSSNLMRELKLLDTNADFRFWGGDLMLSVAYATDSTGTLVKHYRELAFMGFFEVLLNIRTILKNLKLCKKDIAQYQPDVLILVDYPGFNLRIAKYAKNSGIRVFYYISPQIWAWKKSRIKIIRQYVDKMFVILPFEKDFYKQLDYSVDFVGHPLLDAIEQRNDNQFEELNTDTNPGCIIKKYNGVNIRIDTNYTNEIDKPIIAIIPGSRKQEISQKLPVMLSIINNYSDYQFVIAAVSSIDIEYYKKIIGDYALKIIYNQTYEVLKQSVAALVTSGTATLETALFNVPQVVCYKSGAISYHIAKKLVKVRFISLVNLIMDKEIVKELIQDALNTKNLKKELDKILFDNEHRNLMISNYKLLKQRLGGRGASQRAAELMYGYLKR